MGIQTPLCVKVGKTSRCPSLTRNDLTRMDGGCGQVISFGTCSPAVGVQSLQHETYDGRPTTLEDHSLNVGQEGGTRRH